MRYTKDLNWINPFLNPKLNAETYPLRGCRLNRLTDRRLLWGWGVIIAGRFLMSLNLLYSTMRPFAFPLN